MEFKKDYGFLNDELSKLGIIQEMVKDFVIIHKVPDIDPLSPSSEEREILIDYFHHLYALLDCQSILYTRLQLMKDSDLFGILDAIVMFCGVLGLEEDESISEFHQSMKQECKDALTDLTGIDMDSYEGIDIDYT